MGATGVKEAARAGSSRAFASAAELRDVLDRVLRAIDADPEAGPRLRAADTAVRLEVRDLGLILNVAASDDPEHCIAWSFSDRVGWEPKLRLTMDSDVANSYLQGKENVAIASVRGRIAASCDPRVALRYFPTAQIVFERYRKVLKRSHPRLVLD
jgi:hypothetical protein